MRGRKHPEQLMRTTITLPQSTVRRLEELMLLMRLSRSEVISYLVERENDRRISELARHRETRRRNFVLVDTESAAE